jgi:hypothetical protein
MQKESLIVLAPKGLQKINTRRRDNMSIRIRSLVFVLLMIILFSSVVSGQDKPKNLLIGGIFTTEGDKITNQGYAGKLDAKLVPTYGGGEVQDLAAVRDATPEEKFYTKDPDTGILIMKDVKPKATDLNGLTSEYLQRGEKYDTIYSHSGGTRTAVSALLYQGVTAEKLVLISPTTGGLTSKHQELFKWELQQLLDLGIVKEIVVYQAEEDNAPAGSLWQAKFKPGDINGNGFEIEDLSGKLDGKTGDLAHKQMWKTALSLEHKSPIDPYQPIPKSLLKKEFLESLTNPRLSPYSNSYTSGFSDPNKEGPDVSETSDGVLYTEKGTDVWYIDLRGGKTWSTNDRSLYPKPPAPLYLREGELNTYGYNWIYIPADQRDVTYWGGYYDWVVEYLASIGSPGPSAGVGLLVDEGNGGGGW